MRWRTAAFRRCRDYFACGDLRLAVERKEGSDGDQRPGRPVAAARSRLPGPARENDVRVELRGLQPVPGPERYGRPFRIFTMWLSPQFTPSALFIGVLTASLGLSFGQGLPAIVTGNITGALVVAAPCTRGPRTGMGQMPLSRAAFRKSDVLPGVVNWASAIGWVAFNNVFGALGVLAMIAIYLATVAADIVNDYAGSLSLQAAGSPSAGRRSRLSTAPRRSGSPRGSCMCRARCTTRSRTCCCSSPTGSLPGSAWSSWTGSVAAAGSAWPNCGTSASSGGAPWR